MFYLVNFIVFLKIQFNFKSDDCNMLQKSWDRGNLRLITIWWVETGDVKQVRQLCHSTVYCIRSLQKQPSPSRARIIRDLSICQQMLQQIIQHFENNVPQRQIGRILGISPSTVHNIVKRFKESGQISVRKGQDENHFWVHVISDPSDVTVLKKISPICNGYHEHGLGITLVNLCLSTPFTTASTDAS